MNTRLVCQNQLVPMAQYANVYSFRAECQHDVEVWLRLLRVTAGTAGLVEVTGFNLRFQVPDVVVEVRTSASADTVLNALRMVPDGHVMVQTFRPVPKSQNSLERNYDAS